MLKSLWQNKLFIDNCATRYKAETPSAWEGVLQACEKSEKAGWSLKDVPKHEQEFLRSSEVRESGDG